MQSKSQKINFYKCKELLGASSGTILQWYDFSLFSLLSPIIATNYFPSGDINLSIIKTFMVFAVGFILGPIGSIYFGNMGDKYGRKTAMSKSILFMTIPTTIMCFLPTYQQIGVMAPIILVIIRMFQGFVASAEFANSAIFLVEHAPEDKKGLFGSISGVSYSIGFVCGTIIVSIFTIESMPIWAWRIPFLISSVGAIVIYFIRHKIDETDVFINIVDKNISYNKYDELFEINSIISSIFTVSIAGLAGVITYGFYGYGVAFMAIYCDISLSTGALIVMLGMITDALLEPIVAYISDRIGHFKVICIGIILIAIFSPIIFSIILSKNLYKIILAYCFGSILLAIFYAPVHAYTSLLFPPEFRCRRYSFYFNIGITVFGGTTPMIMAWLIEKTGSPLMPGLYISIFSIIVISILLSFKSVTYSKRSYIN